MDPLRARPLKRLKKKIKKQKIAPAPLSHNFCFKTSWSFILVSPSVKWGSCFRADKDWRKRASGFILQMGRLRLQVSRRWSCVQASPGSGGVPDPQVGDGFHSSLGTESGGSEGPGTNSGVLGGGIMELWDVGPR